MSDSYLGFNPDKFTLWSPGFSGAPKSPTAPAGTNTDQIATTAFASQAAQSSSSTYAVGTGSASAHTATYLPAVSTLTDGMVLRFRAANTNTGASTFSPNGLPAKPIITSDHNPLSGGEITAGAEVWLQYNAALDSWVSLSIGIKPSTTSSLGILEIATNEEAILGTDVARAIVPSSLAAVIANLSLGTMSKQSSGSVAITGGSISGITDLAIADGGTGASTAAQALANLGGAPLASPALTGTPTAPTAAVGNSTTQVATTAFVNNEIANDRPFEATASNIKMNGTQAVGSLNTVARGDHVHPTDTTRAPLASPALTGTPTAPTAADGTNTTQLATTAFVQGAIGGYLSKSGLTGGTVTLTDAEASNPVIAFSGTLTSNLVVVVPVTIKRLWAVFNATSGAFTLTVKTASGSGVAVAQGRRNLVYTDGTNVYDGFNDFESIAMTGTPTAPTAAVGTNTTQLATTAFTKAQIAADVPTMISGQAVGAVGTYGFFMLYGGTTGVNIAPGATIAGSNLRYSAAGWGGTTAPAGTWRVMGAAADADGGDTNSITLCMRIS